MKYIVINSIQSAVFFLFVFLWFLYFYKKNNKRYYFLFAFSFLCSFVFFTGRAVHFALFTHHYFRLFFLSFQIPAGIFLYKGISSFFNKKSFHSIYTELLFYIIFFIIGFTFKNEIYPAFYSRSFQIICYVYTGILTYKTSQNNIMRLCGIFLIINPFIPAILFFTLNCNELINQTIMMFYFYIAMTFPVFILLNELFETLNNLKRSHMIIETVTFTKRALSSVFTHNYKNPLLAVYGYLELLNNGRFGELNNIQKQKIDIIIENLKIMDELILKIGNLTKITSNSLDNIEKIDVNKLISHIISQLKNEFKTEIIFDFSNEIIINNVYSNVFFAVFVPMFMFCRKNTELITISSETSNKRLYITATDINENISDSEVDIYIEESQKMGFEIKFDNTVNSFCIIFPEVF